MKKFFLITFFSLFFFQFSTAQCDANEIQIKVEIATDSYGYETSWVLTNLIGDVILQGGQDGVYMNNSMYADSICVAEDGCFFFEIYDTYGDGIFAPNGYKIFVDNELVASGADDIDSYAKVTASCPNQCNLITTSLTNFQDHINGNTTLSNDELMLVRNTFSQFPSCLIESESNLLLAKNVVADYDSIKGALFTTPTTQNGFSKDASATPNLADEQAMVALQQSLFDVVFTPEVYENYPQHIEGWIFNSCHSFPGYVDPPTDATISHSMLIRANFSDPDGMNPYFDINGDNTDHALRPTGLYLSPGSIAKVTVPDSLVGQDYYVRVGSHEWDLGIRPIYRRLDRISKKFAIDSTTIEVYNPFGGAISILVPYGADDGIVEVSVTNGVQCPFFSLKPFYETTDFEAELTKPGPWAVFETDNVMFTIPSHSIIPGEYDIRQAMLDWDAALQGVNSVMARQIIPEKHNMYMIADITIRHNVYSIGYPMSNTPLNFTSVPGPTYFLNGPGPDDETNFHESGHALAMSKFPGETEALVNVPYIMAMNHGLNVDLNEAVNYSFVPNTFDIDKTATHRMCSNTFGTERIIENATTNEVRYQHRGYGHYFEIVNMFGWCPLRNFWKQEYIDFENGINHGINNQDIDGRILRMSVAAQVDLRPLFHVFGILPQDSIALQDTFEQLDIKPSLTVYNRLQAYFDLIPNDNDAFVEYALFVYPNLYTNGPTDDPNYGVGWHYQKSLTYDENEAEYRKDILQSIIDLYYPNGAPEDVGNPDLCCLLDTMIVDYVDEEVIVAGGVKPYDITVEFEDNIQTITVVDFDGCETTMQFIINSSSEAQKDFVKIYPNPASTELYIDLSESDQQIHRIQLLSIEGQMVKNYRNTERVIDLSALNSGMYILSIELMNGQRINQRVLVVR